MKYVNRQNTAHHLTWRGVVDAIKQGHRWPRTTVSDQLLNRSEDALLSRAAWIDGLGFGVKSVSVMPGNRAFNLPSIQGAMLVFHDQTGSLDAIVEGTLVTDWKTAGDSLLGAEILAPPNPKTYLVVGAGTVAANLVRAYSELFPTLQRIVIWNRSKARGKALVDRLKADDFPVALATNLQEACAEADIISTATIAHDPVIRGDWVSPGTHIDLIGAFTPAMREADDTLLRKGRLFVDCFDTTLDHIGELMIPLASGAIRREDVLGDLYDLVQEAPGRLSEADVTIFKNGGGAHLDLMVAKHIMAAAAVDP